VLTNKTKGVNAMTSDKTNKWYRLYSNNSDVYPSDNQYADGYVGDSCDNDMSDSLDQIAEAAEEWTDDHKYDTSNVHIWRDASDQGYNFKMPDSYWENEQRKEAERDSDDDDL